MLHPQGGGRIDIIERTAEAGDGSFAVSFQRATKAVRAAALPADGNAPAGSGSVGLYLEGIADPLIAVDSRWTITYANRAAAGRLGSDDEAPLIGQGFWEQFPKSVRELIGDAFENSLEDGETSQVVFAQPELGRWYEAGLYPMAGGLLILLRDITHQREQEEVSNRLDKMEALGLLARGFAHEFNNILTVILGNLSLALERMPAGLGCREDITTARDATGDAQSRVQQLLTFASGGNPSAQRSPSPRSSRMSSPPGRACPATATGSTANKACPPCGSMPDKSAGSSEISSATPSNQSDPAGAVPSRSAAAWSRAISAPDDPRPRASWRSRSRTTARASFRTSCPGSSNPTSPPAAGKTCPGSD